MSQVKKQKSSNSSVQQTDSSLKRWAVIPAEDILTQLDTNISTGLNQEQVRRNQQQYGYNELTTRKAISAFEILVRALQQSHSCRI